MKIAFTNPGIFQEKIVPADTTLVGMSALVHALNVEAPVRKPTCVSFHRVKEVKRYLGEWRLFDSKYAVENTVEAHLVFAIRHEEIDLLVLKRIFLAVPKKVIAAFVKTAPTGPVVRRIWFLYEFLTGNVLNVPDSGKVANVDALDGDHYFVSQGKVSLRHRVKNNFLGTNQFCPIIRRSKTLVEYIDKNLAARAQSLVSAVSPVLIARAASFLLLADTQASFAIEGERLPGNIRERWLKAVQQAGKHALSKDELNRLHSILMGNYRFSKPGFRPDCVFIGRRTADYEPLPEFIGARPEDLENLMEGLIEADIIMGNSTLDAVLQAAAIAFGFVFIHPFEDGNGRLHRCLIHHVLAKKQFSPERILFPVSSVLLRWISEYETVLKSHSAPLMNFIQWTPTINGNVSVKNDTTDLYRFFDCTEAAEFLYRCVCETVEKVVRQELDYLKRHDKAMRHLTQIVEMPNRLAEDFIVFSHQNNWKLLKKRRQKEFRELTDAEVTALESVLQKIFQD